MVFWCQSTLKMQYGWQVDYRNRQKYLVPVWSFWFRARTRHLLNYCCRFFRWVCEHSLSGIRIIFHQPYSRKICTSFGDRSFAIAGPCTWNNLLDAIRDSSLVILNIRKTVEIILVCLTTAAPVIFNWRLTNVLTKVTNYILFWRPPSWNSGGYWRHAIPEVTPLKSLTPKIWG